MKLWVLFLTSYHMIIITVVIVIITIVVIIVIVDIVIIVSNVEQFFVGCGVEVVMPLPVAILDL